MIKRLSEGSLTIHEKRIVKRLLARGWRNQDIQAQINLFRNATINSARITEVKQNDRQKLASDEETDFFLKKKSAYDPKTKLNFYDDERLIRAREAMMLATQVFNSAGLNFKTEVFAVLANISWTYLLHEYYERKGVSILGDDGRSLLLSKMLRRRDCPLPEGVKNNLEAIKLIRDDVEHLLLGKSDIKWQALYQACCLNFEKTIVDFFGSELSLADDLSFALQFSKLDFEHSVDLSKFDLPPHIQALDARLQKKLSEDELNDLDYQFRVVYTFDAASKSKSHIQFVNPDSSEGKQISTVLAKTKIADELYPYKPAKVCELVEKASGKSFTTHNHTQAWKSLKVRPKSGAKHPNETNKDYCIFHAAHKDYTYSGAWVELLSDIVVDPARLTALKEYKD